MASGEYVSFRAIGAVIRDDEGKPSLIGGIMVNQGLTENTDPVTVLPNRNIYTDDLSKLMKEGKRCFSLEVGIGKMSEINKLHGYTFGNRVLQETAWLIQETVKDRGTVYRMDDAKFAVLSDKLTRDETAAVYLRSRVDK